MEKSMTIGIAGRATIGIAGLIHRDGGPFHRDSGPSYRDSEPTHVREPAPCLTLTGTNCSLPYFYLFLPKRGAPLRGSPTFGGSPSHITTSRLCGLSHWRGHPGQRYTNRSAASRLRPLCTVCAYGLPGAKGRRSRVVSAESTQALKLLKDNWQKKAVLITRIRRNHELSNR